MAKLAPWLGIIYSVVYYSSMVSGTPVCVYKGTFYISDTEIYDRGCNVAYCDKMARLVYRHGCSASTGLPITSTKNRQMFSAMTTFPPFTSTAFGCRVNGKVYPPNTQINNGESHASNWCYGSYCDSSGLIQYWDNFNCFTTSSPPPTTVPQTTIPETTVPETTIPTKLSTLLSGKGCYYNGHFYPANTNLGAPDDRATKYCTKCDENAQIQHWYDFDCFRTGPTPPGSTPPIIG